MTDVGGFFMSLEGITAIAKNLFTLGILEICKLQRYLD
jgi:hypothetical protein